MNNVSALSRVVTVPQGRDEPGTWEQNPEGFMDFMQALISRNEPPDVQADTPRTTPQDNGFWTVPRMTATPKDTDVKNVGIPTAAEGQEDLMSLVALLTGEEDNDGFLRALEQYIAQNPEILEAYNALFSVESTETPAAWLEGLIEAFKPEEGETLPPELMPLLMLWSSPEPEAPVAEEAVISGTPGLIEWDLTDTKAVSETPKTPEVPAALPEDTAFTVPVADAENPAETLKTPIATQQEPITPPDVQTAEPYVQTPAVTQTPLSEGLTELILPEDAEVKTILQVPAEEALTGETGEPTPAAAASAKPLLSYANMLARAVAGTMRWTDKETENAQVEGQLAETQSATVTEGIPEPVGEPQAARMSETSLFASSDGNTEDSPDGGTSPKSDGVQFSQQTQAPARAEQAVADNPPAARQVLAKDIISQIVQNTAQPRETSVLQMELHPKFLGKIEILLEAAGGSITAKLKSDNGAVRSLLNENIAELRDALKQAGINMKDVEVTETAIRAGLSDRQYQRHEQASETQHSAKPIRIMPFAVNAAEEIEPLSAMYETGRVASPGSDTMFDYRA